MKRLTTPNRYKLTAFRIFWSKAMSKKRLNDSLEFCLQTLEQDRNIDSALSEFPEIAIGLQPLLEVSLLARDCAVLSVPDEAISRGREKLFRRLEELQNERLCRRTALSLPLIVHSVQHTWKSIRLSLFINRHMRHHKDKTDDHMPTPQS